MKIDIGKTSFVKNLDKGTDNRPVLVVLISLVWHPEFVSHHVTNAATINWLQNEVPLSYQRRISFE